MHEITSRAAIIVFAVCLLRGPASSQGIPVIGESASSKREKPLEAEQVELHRLYAIPSQLRRPHGEFLLVLDNQTGNRNAEFVIESGAAGERMSSSQLLLPFDHKTPDVRHRRAGVLNPPPGTYYLKSADSGHTFCTIIID